MYPIRTRRRNQQDGRTERGYTLTELAVVMAVFMIFMSFAGPVMISHLMGAVRTERRVDLQQNTRAALRTMVREIRQAVALYEEGTKPGKPTGRNAISFGIDLNGDGVINDFNDNSKLLEQVTYFVQGNTLWRGRKQDQGAPLAENVKKVDPNDPPLVFTYFGSNPLFDTDADGVVEEAELNPDGNWISAELANVTRVQISITVTESGTSQTYTADAFLRNRVVG